MDKANVNERQRLYLHNPGAAGPMCFSCKHFVPHYRRDIPAIRGREFVPMHSGHCTFPRGKLRYAYDTCEHWERRETAAEEVKT